MMVVELVCPQNWRFCGQIGGQAEVKWILKQVKSNDKGIRNRKVVWRSQGP